MSEYVYAGLTSQTIDLFIRDSSSTTGQGLTGLAYNSGSLVASYRKGATGSRTAITLATQTVGGAFSSGGFVEIDATNMPGCYRLDLPNAAVDTAGFVTVFLKGAANMVPVALRIDCRPVPADLKQIGADAQSATDLKDFADAGYDPSTNKLTGAVELDSASILAVADQVWDEDTSGHTTGGTYGGRIVRATNSNTEVQITGSNHIAADVHEFQAGVITAGDFAANAITASALAADAVAEIQSGLATAANVSTVGAQVTAVQTVLTGITSLANWLRRAFRKDAGSAGMIVAETEIQTGGTATYLGTTDNLEAIKDAGGGGGSGDASQTTLLAVQVTTTAIAASLAGTAIEVAGRVASGGGITLYIGDDCTVASGTQLTITVSDPAGGLYAILNAIPIGNLAWGASRARSASSLIPGTITSLGQSGSGASTLLLISVEIVAAGTAAGCVAADDYEYQISSRSNTTDDFVRIEGTLNLLPRRVAIP